MNVLQYVIDQIRLIKFLIDRVNSNESEFDVSPNPRCQLKVNFRFIKCDTLTIAIVYLDFMQRSRHLLFPIKMMFFLQSLQMKLPIKSGFFKMYYRKLSAQNFAKSRVARVRYKS